jgi:hypothetical protein
MATKLNLHRTGEADNPSTIPSPAKVRAAAEEIRSSWTPIQRRRRAELARYLLWHQVLSGSQPDPRP